MEALYMFVGMICVVVAYLIMLRSERLLDEAKELVAEVREWEADQ